MKKKKRNKISFRNIKKKNRKIKSLKILPSPRITRFSTNSASKQQLLYNFFSVHVQRVKIRATLQYSLSLSLFFLYITGPSLVTVQFVSDYLWISAFPSAFYIPLPVSKLLVRKWREQFYRVFVNAPSRVSYPKSNESNLYRLIRAGGILSPPRLCKNFYTRRRRRFFRFKRMNIGRKGWRLIRSRLSHQFEPRSTPRRITLWGDGEWGRLELENTCPIFSVFSSFLAMELFRRN